MAEIITGVARRPRFTIGRTPAAVTETMQRGRSIGDVARRCDQWPQRGPRDRNGDCEVVAEIRTLVDQRPTCGSPPVKRKWRPAGDDRVNAKGVYRLMRSHGLLLATHAGR